MAIRHRRAAATVATNAATPREPSPPAVPPAGPTAAAEAAPPSCRSGDRATGPRAPERGPPAPALPVESPSSSEPSLGDSPTSWRRCAVMGDGAGGGSPAGGTADGVLGEGLGGEPAGGGSTAKMSSGPRQRSIPTGIRRRSWCGERYTARATPTPATTGLARRPPRSAVRTAAVSAEVAEPATHAMTVRGFHRYRVGRSVAKSLAHWQHPFPPCAAEVLLLEGAWHRRLLRQAAILPSSKAFATSNAT
mmetsp:Transcript_531/g.1174  ORF Transcript_531/g.1174 Transcript_531/m.1174 type:complete len:249 (+) Transcript_531:667-1413(+)